MSKFIETDKERAKKIMEYLESVGIPYMCHSTKELVHIDIENMTDEQANRLKKYYSTLEAPKVEIRHRKWDEKFHTTMDEIRGEMTGANREEEVEYVNE